MAAREVKRGDEFYPTLFANWESQGSPRRFQADGTAWIALDGGKTFNEMPLKTGAQFYGDTSVKGQGRRV